MRGMRLYNDTILDSEDVRNDIFIHHNFQYVILIRNSVVFGQHSFLIHLLDLFHIDLNPFLGPIKLYFVKIDLKPFYTYLIAFPAENGYFFSSLPSKNDCSALLLQKPIL